VKRALQLFRRTNSPRHINIASYHSPHSLTWSWILCVTIDGIWRYPPPPLATRKGLRFGFSPYRTNGGLQWVLALPFVTVGWRRQKEMWFRDMFYRAREREEELETRNRELRRLVSLAGSPPEGSA
jgi:hypothetical protein